MDSDEFRNVLDVDGRIGFAGQRAPGMAPAPVFQDNMVLQRDRILPVWGTATPGETVRVTFAGQTRSADADANGVWAVRLDPLPACATGRELVIRGQAEVRFRNVLVGDVWLASGQSNMDFKLPDACNGSAESAAADHPEIRFLKVEYQWAKRPCDTFEGTWRRVIPGDAEHFSAIAYFFARDLQKRLQVPIGVIQSAWGGTPAEAWTPLGELEARTELYEDCLRQHASFAALPEREIARRRFEAEKAQRHEDPGNTGEGKGWAEPETDVSTWKDIEVPGYLETVFGEVDGVFWYRRDVELPADWAGRDLVLHLGAVDDLDTTYFNGELIGSTGFDVPKWWEFRRVYRIPGRLVRPGANTIAVRVMDERHAGGLAGPCVSIEGPGSEHLDLAGAWKITDEAVLEPLPGPDFPWIRHVASYLYNGMIHPFVRFAIRGAIWHQGENNAGRSVIYRTLFKDMISGWRRAFGQGEFPFYYVQLSNYGKREAEPTQASDGWPGLREAQAMAMELPNTGMAVTIDVGEAEDLHPPNKQANGRRLALLALAGTYGLDDVVCRGPMFDSMEVRDGKAVVRFRDAVTPDGDGLVVHGDKLEGFSICGDDGWFAWANAEVVDKDTVWVGSPDVKKPVAVRYAWANNPACNLYNAAGLPAAPFRKDDSIPGNGDV